MTRFADKPTLVGDRVVLRPITAADADDMWADLQDDEARRLTGTHQRFERAQIDEWCASRGGQPDRLDLAVTDRSSGAWAGEVVINDVDPDNQSCNFRIALRASARNRGLGTEATTLLLGHVFGTIDDPPIHRVSLEVYTFNPRALAVYEKAGFVREGVLRGALCWEGEYVDAVVMSALRTDRVH